MAASSARRLLLFLSFFASLRPLTATVVLENACRKTKHPVFCMKALLARPESKTADLLTLAKLSLALVAESGARAVSFVKSLEKMPGGTPAACLEGCLQDFRAIVAQLRKSRAELECREFAGVKASVTAAMADVDACFKSCQTVEGGADPYIAAKSEQLSRMCSVTLALTNAASTHIP